MLVIIDNYDSFTYNIVQTVAANALADGRIEDIRVFRNDKTSVQEIAALHPDRLLISPGRLPRSSGLRRSLWRDGGSGAANNARQDQPDVA